MSVALAQVLYINRYRCRKCKEEYELPNPQLLYLYKNAQTGKPKLVPDGRSWRGLPTEIHYSPFTSIQACKNCFQADSLIPQGELELDPLAPEVHGTQPTPLSMF